MNGMACFDLYRGTKQRINVLGGFVSVNKPYFLIKELFAVS